MTKFTKWKKWQNIISQLYLNHIHILIPWRKHMQSFKTIGTILLEELRSQDTQGKCWRMDGRMTKFAKWKKWQKLMQRLYSNHMHIFRPWRKHVQSFKKIGIKLYEQLHSQVTHCLYIEVKKMTKFTKWKKWPKIISQLYPNHMHILIPWRKHVQSFKKIGTKL